MCLCDSSLIGKEIRRAGKRQRSQAHARSREGSKDTFHCPDPLMLAKAYIPYFDALRDVAKSLVPFSLGPALILCHFQREFRGHF